MALKPKSIVRKPRRVILPAWRGASWGGVAWALLVRALQRIALSKWVLIPQAKPAQARAKPSPPSGFGGPRAQGLRSCKPSQARKPWPEYRGKKIIVGSQFTLKILLVGPYALKYNFTAQISVVLDSCKCNYWEDFASVIWPESPNETNMVKTKSELTSTPRKSPGPGQARPSPVGGLGLGPEDFRAQARPSQAQALAFRPSQALGITSIKCPPHLPFRPSARPAAPLPPLPLALRSFSHLNHRYQASPSRGFSPLSRPWAPAARRRRDHQNGAGARSPPLSPFDFVHLKTNSVAMSRTRPDRTYARREPLRIVPDGRIKMLPMLAPHPSSFQLRTSSLCTLIPRLLPRCIDALEPGWHSYSRAGPPVQELSGPHASPAPRFGPLAPRLAKV
ncbi:hypothetical protein C8R47DRAFT_1063599 [Mycena vitilis]|nr:hypothetical protein C8R47DRAFT_1063599 [Mycena vitilis]